MREDSTDMESREDNSVPGHFASFACITFRSLFAVLEAWFLCDAWGFHSADVEDSGLLGCYAI
jgi:hypothetical protein